MSVSEARFNLITVGLWGYDVSGCGVLFGIFYVDPVLEYLPMCFLHPLYWLVYRLDKI